MIAVPSEIRLENFVVLQSRYSFTAPKKKINSQQLFKSYIIDIDFVHQENKDKKTMHVFTKIAVNESDDPAPGYKLFVEGAALFSLDQISNLPEEEQKNLKYYSTVSILIGYLRNTLTALTSCSPMGRYLLPPINISDLFKKKADEK